MIRFEEVLAEQLSQPLRMQQLCEQIGVGERTLRSCCAAFLGVSPTRYVLLRRLKQARIALREADPAAASVAEIACACGFTELGRFAGVYIALSGKHLQPRCAACLGRGRAAQNSPNLHSRGKNRGLGSRSGHASPEPGRNHG